MANTDWKLTDLWNASLFTFDSTNGWHPTNENQTPDITGDKFNVPWDNLGQKVDWGLGVRKITLQGMDVADGDLWDLSSAICKRQLMKLWVGEDWFYYVLGTEPRQVRDVSAPYQKSYTVAFEAMDPHYYSARIEGTGASAVRWGKQVCAAGGGTIVVDLTKSGTDNSGVDDKATTMVDTTKNFAGLGVLVDGSDTITNDTDGSSGTIASLSTTTNPFDTINFTGLTGGTDNDFDDGDAYTVTAGAYPTTAIEPCFWVKGIDGAGADPNITMVTITDDKGRKLEYTPTSAITKTAGAAEHVIMPWRNTVQEGFMVNPATGFRLTTNGESNTNSPWDSADYAFSCFDYFCHGAGTDDSASVGGNTYGWITEEEGCVLSRNGSSYIYKNRQYPLILPNASTTLTVSFTGAADDSAVYALWSTRRV